MTVSILFVAILAIFAVVAVCFGLVEMYHMHRSYEDADEKSDEAVDEPPASDGKPNEISKTQCNICNSLCETYRTVGKFTVYQKVPQGVSSVTFNIVCIDCYASALTDPHGNGYPAYFYERKKKEPDEPVTNTEPNVSNQPSAEGTPSSV